ncbi:MAG: SDR family NAD(P)-dependent oxidoreductase [Longimicrobiales bacterium]|nr:SDR family NAD(P)-dependent oxidoreductase [Longimicrobiales bacterium]
MRRSRSMPLAAVAPLALAVIPALASAQTILPDTPAPAPASLEGRSVALITGSTSGLGRATALALGEEGWHVIVHGRNEARGREVVREIEEGRGSATLYTADLGSVDETAALAEAVLRDFERLDVLVNNAGIWLAGDDARRTSADGHELSFHVNYLAGFQLTHALLPLLKSSAPSRVVNVASIAQNEIDFDDVMLERGYSGGRAYGQSKLAQILFTFDLAEALEGTGVSVNALHPATLMDTQMVRDAGVRPRATVEEGRDAVLRLVLDPGVGTGGYFDGREPARAHPQAYDEAARARLRALSERLVGR